MMASCSLTIYIGSVVVWSRCDWIETNQDLDDKLFKGDTILKPLELLLRILNGLFDEVSVV